MINGRGLIPMQHIRFGGGSELMKDGDTGGVWSAMDQGVV